MKNMKELVENFKCDIVDYIEKMCYVNFNFKSYFDKYEEVYFFFHNAKDLDDDEKFDKFLTDKLKEYFYSNAIYNVCFTYDFRLMNELGEARSEPLRPTLEEMLIRAADKLLKQKDVWQEKEETLKYAKKTEVDSDVSCFNIFNHETRFKSFKQFLGCRGERDAA